MTDPLLDQASDTARGARRVSDMLGCTGIHRTAEGWMPCASPEELVALLDGGVTAYREVSNKGLIGSVVSRVRRVAVNPKARDADGDGLVQEGTTAQRSARKAGVKPQTAIRTVAKEPTKKARVPKADVQRIEAHFAPMLEKIDADLIKLGGLGRFRTKQEGPRPEVVSRMADITKSVEDVYGPLETLKEIEAALQKGFPNAKVSLKEKVSPTESFKRSAQKITPLNAEDPLAEFGPNSSEALAMMRGFSKSILFKANEDPQAAALVGSIVLNGPESRDIASVGMSVGLSSNTPLQISFSPSLKEKGTSPEAMAYSAALKDDLKRRDAVKKNADGNWSHGFGTFTNSDKESSAAWYGFHEWGHLKGLALAHETRTPEFMENIQKWVATGEEQSWMTAYPELTVADNRVRRTLMAVEREGKLSEAVASYVERLGFQNVDISNQEQLRAIYRAVAARNLLSIQLMDALEERTRNLELKDWQEFDTISGYGNIDVEEGIAELMALNGIAPEVAKERYATALDIPAIKERL